MKRETKTVLNFGRFLGYQGVFCILYSKLFLKGHCFIIFCFASLVISLDLKVKDVFERALFYDILFCFSGNFAGFEIYMETFWRQLDIHSVIVF